MSSLPVTSGVDLQSMHVRMQELRMLYEQLNHSIEQTKQNHILHMQAAAREIEKWKKEFIETEREIDGVIQELYHMRKLNLSLELENASLKGKKITVKTVSEL
jgi:hypothetical protein